jgi:hypothetical protein
MGGSLLTDKGSTSKYHIELLWCHDFSLEYYYTGPPNQFTPEKEDNLAMHDIYYVSQRYNTITPVHL